MRAVAKMFKKKGKILKFKLIIAIARFFQLGWYQCGCSENQKLADE